MDKFRGNVGNWIQHIQRLEKDLPKAAVSYTLQDDETYSEARRELRGSRNGLKGIWSETEY